MNYSKKQLMVAVESLAEEYVKIEIEKQRLDKEARQLKKRMENLKESIQNVIGKAEEVEMPIITRVGRYYITQILKHRDVEAYSYDFIEFKIV